MLLLLLPLLASGAPSSGPCCTSKTVGGLEYTLVREDSSALSLSCLSPCVYERSGMPGGAGGPQYCFARGEQTVFCGNSTSNVAGITQINKKSFRARKPGVYWEELSIEPIEGVNVTNCTSKLHCSSIKDSIMAFVLIDVDWIGYGCGEEKNVCDIADCLILQEAERNTTDIKNGSCPAQPANQPGAPQDYTYPITMTVTITVGCMALPSSTLNFCPWFENSFEKSANLNWTKNSCYDTRTNYGWVKYKCCCATPQFRKDQNVCTKCENINFPVGCMNK